MTRTAEKSVIAFVAAGLFAMLAVALVACLRPQAPAHSHAEQAQERMETAGMQGMPPGMNGMGGMPASRVGMLMQHLADKPNDIAALKELSEELIKAGQYDAAEEFLNKLVLFDTRNPHGTYMLGYIRAQKGQFDKAAELMEQSLTFQDDPAVHFSVGVIYRYYLKNTEKALEHWRKGEATAGINEGQRKAFQDEIAKAQQPTTN